MKLRMASLAFVGLLLIAIPAAFAQDIYDNGPTNGNIDSWLINF